MKTFVRTIMSQRRIDAVRLCLCFFEYDRCCLTAEKVIYKILYIKPFGINFENGFYRICRWIFADQNMI